MTDRISAAEYQARQAKKPKAKPSPAPDSDEKLTSNKPISAPPIQDIQSESLTLSDIKYLMNVYLSQVGDKATISGLNMVLKENRIRVELILK